MHARKRNNALKPLQLTHDQRAMRPRTGVRDVEMVPASLGRELAAFLDEGAELRLAAFELASFVVGRYPVGYLIFCLLFGSSSVSMSSAPHLESLCGVRRTIMAVVEKNALPVLIEARGLCML